MKKLIGFVLVALATMLVTEPVFAQSDATSKMRGEYNFRGSSASRSMRNAREYSHAYREYAQTPQLEKVNPEVAKETSNSIGEYIPKAQKHMAWMRKQAAGDKETLVSLDLIDASLKDAAKSHKAMHDLCEKEDVDADGSMKCCEQIDESLATAIAEHDKLMKRLADNKKAVSKK